MAVQSAADWHLVAVDPRLGDLHGGRFPTPEDAARVAADHAAVGATLRRLRIS